MNSFWNSLLILFSLFTFFSRKNQPRNLYFLFLFSPFSVSLLLSTFFLIFYHHFFFHHFFLPFYLFIPFCFSPLFLFSPFSILSLFLYLSVSLSLFFLSLMFTHLFFSIAVVAYPLFVLTHFSSVSLFWSWSLCFLASSHFFFFISVSVFFQKKSNFSVVNFLKTKLCLYFLNPPVICVKSRVFSSLRRHFSLFVLCFLLLRFFIVTFLDHRYFSWFSFINLLFGPLKKNSFCFVGKFKHIILLSMSSLWTYLVSLCFCPKKKTFKKWLILFIFSLDFFPIRSLFMCTIVMFTLLVVTLPTDKKIGQKKKKTCVLLLSFAHFSKKLTKT